jgi:GTP-binding protein YchF
MLADMEAVRRRKERTVKLARQQAGAQAELVVLEKIEEALDEAIPARQLGLSEEERGRVRELSLLTLKPVIYVANVAEADAATTSGARLDEVAAIAGEEKASWLVISARIEAELQDIDPGDRLEFLHSLGLEESGLGRLAREAYRILGLITFLTAGETECRAWTIRRGTRAPQAAGTIHGDFERGFIKAEVIGWKELVDAGGWTEARALGKVRIEGKEYVFQDGDTTIFRFNV